MYGRTDRQTDRQTDRETEKLIRVELGNLSVPPVNWPNKVNLPNMGHIQRVKKNKKWSGVSSGVSCKQSVCASHQAVAISPCFVPSESPPLRVKRRAQC